MSIGRALAAVLILAAAVIAVAPRPGRVIALPAGVVELREPMRLPRRTEVFGSPHGTTLRMASDFAGASLLEANDGVYIHDLTIDGNRDAREVRQGLPPWNQPFTGYTRGNGIAVDGHRGVTIRGVRFRRIAGFAILAARSREITIDNVRVEASGSRDAAGRNNTTGGILLEEGTIDFRVTNCEFRGIRGNGVWTHSLYTSPRNARGLITNNRFDTIARDAIQVGHATSVQVLDNVGWRIGYPLEEVDALPVAIDTAGNVDASIYAGNRFATIEGKCIDLDGFHDGEVRGNSCANLTGYGIVMNNTNPDMQSSHIRIVDNLIDGAGFGGVFVIGHDNLVAHNRLLNLNMRHCNDGSVCYYTPGEPDMLRSGIYLGQGAERPGLAKGNVIEWNTITGYRMNRYCIGGGPRIYPDWNTVRGNRCN